MVYHVVLDGSAHGPYEIEVLAQLARDGRLDGDTLIWAEGLVEWTPARTVPEVAALLSSEQSPAATAKPPPADPDSAVEAPELEPAAASAPAAAVMTPREEILPEPAAPAAGPEEVDSERRPARFIIGGRAGTVAYRIDDGLRGGWRAWKRRPFRAVFGFVLFACLAAALGWLGSRSGELAAMIADGGGEALAQEFEPPALDEDILPAPGEGPFELLERWLEDLPADRLIALLPGAVIYFLSYILLAGYMAFNLRHLRDEPVTIFGVLSGLRRPLSLIVASIAIPIVIVFGLLLFVLPGIYFAVRYAFAPLAIVDRGIGPFAGMALSARAVGAVGWWHSLALLHVMAWVVLLGGLAFGIGVLVAVPLAFAAFAGAYHVGTASQRPA